MKFILRHWDARTMRVPLPQVLVGIHLRWWYSLSCNMMTRLEGVMQRLRASNSLSSELGSAFVIASPGLRLPDTRHIESTRRFEMRSRQR